MLRYQCKIIRRALCNTSILFGNYLAIVLRYAGRLLSEEAPTAAEASVTGSFNNGQNGSYMLF
ncbi:MAG: hypothetical protein WKI04_18025 [Ferruginibacter sp.]